MLTTPQSGRLHIALFGRRNAGKSSIINALTNQDCALVSPVAGTTTDPVFKAMEVLPLGPVVLIDTAGIDDEGSLGTLRVARTMDVLRKTDLAILVISADQAAGSFEEQLVTEIREKGIPLIGVVNGRDMGDPSKNLQWFVENGIPCISSSCLTGAGIEELKGLIIKTGPDNFGNPPLVRDLMSPGDVVISVTPIDSAAPKGRLILPQVQVIRDVLDGDGINMVVEPERLKAAIASCAQQPCLVVTDSQAFKEVSRIVPDHIPLTSFSIIMARYKGDLQGSVEGLCTLERLGKGSKVLIAEGCTHHRQNNDIGKVQMPVILNKLVGEELEFYWASGGGFPKDLSEYDLILHCGGCMVNRREMLYRIALAREAQVSLINYGILLAYYNGILPRVLAPLERGGIHLDIPGQRCHNLA